MTVYVTQEPSPKVRKDRNGNETIWVPDLSSASDYGEIRYVFSSGEQVHMDSANCLRRANAVLRDFDPEEDFILYANSGDPASKDMCIAILARYYDKIPQLYWNRKIIDGKRDRSQGFYQPFIMDLTEFN